MDLFYWDTVKQIYGTEGELVDPFWSRTRSVLLLSFVPPMGRPYGTCKSRDDQVASYFI